MKLVIPVESIVQKKGGVILYDPEKNEILKQYVHDKSWKYERVGWRGGCIYGNYLIATDWTDIHIFNYKEWKYVKTFKKNTFNDLHYVDVHGDKLYVVNTGLDAIEIFSNPLNPKFEEIKFVFEANKKLFGSDRKINVKEKYNEKFKIKPHLCHPNCICFIGDKKIITCFAKKQRIGSGEIIDLKTGERLSEKNYDCHDGLIHNGNFYATRTRHAQILRFDNILEQKWPMKPTQVYHIKKPGWWRGMVIYGNTVYVFASDGYRKKKTTMRMAKVNLKTSKRNIVKLPEVDGVFWDTVYEPNIWED